MHAEALVIYGANGLAREMLYSEFAAVLDGVVTQPELAGQSAEAVYVQLDGRLQISVMIFFRLPFDPKGHVSADWNMPLQAMADKATLGPLLAGANTRIMCRSQCPQKWHAQLWEPRERQGCDPFEDLHARLVKNNRLRLLPELRDQEASEDHAQQLQQLELEWSQRVSKMAHELRMARERIAVLEAENGKLRHYIKALKIHYRKFRADHDARRSA